ncbi:MAG: hypothetical protein ABSE46_16445 [Terracidiphilus sp.]
MAGWWDQSQSTERCVEKRLVIFENLKAIEAVTLERRISGASSCIFAEACDGFKYVVKGMEDGSRARIAFREAFGTSVFAALGILVPAWRPIYFSNALIEAHELDCLDKSGTGKRILPGIHFASRFVGEDHRRAYERIPGSWYGRIRNRTDFWGGFVIDQWLNSSHPRQSLFLSEEDDLELWALFVSHSGISIEPESPTVPLPDACFYPDGRVYPRTNVISSIDFWIDKIRRNGEEVVQDALTALHPAWRTSSIPEFGERVVGRISQLGERVYGALCAEMKGDSMDAVRSVRTSRLHPVGISALIR